MNGWKAGWMDGWMDILKATVRIWKSVTPVRSGCRLKKWNKLKKKGMNKAMARQHQMPIPVFHQIPHKWLQPAHIQSSTHSHLLSLTEA